MKRLSDFQQESLLEREYYVAPRKRRKRRHILPATVLLGMLLFAGGFLLGKASAAFIEVGPLPNDKAEMNVIDSIVLEPSAAGGTKNAGETAGLAESAQSGETGAEMNVIGSIVLEPPAAGGTKNAGETAGSAGSAQSAEDWALLLVNWENPLPEEFEIPKLTQLKNGHAIDSRAYPALQAMMDAARAEGLQPLICSSYRTWDKQEGLFARKVQAYLNQGYGQAEAEEQAAQWVARPGTSEHQVGLAVDIVDTSYQLLDEAQEETPVQQWLMAHCAEYGFILRYPTEKSALTGVNYEPWHYRYVGEAAAREIMEQGLCLEEYVA